MCVPSIQPLQIQKLKYQLKYTRTFSNHKYQRGMLLLLSHFSHVRLLATTWITARQASLSITNSQGSPKLMWIELVVPSSHLILCSPIILLPSILPSIRVFSSESAFSSGGQNIGASASFLPMNTQGWSPLRLTGWISLQSTGLSRIFSSTTIQKHQFFGAQPSLWFQLSHLYTTTGNYTPV